MSSRFKFSQEIFIPYFSGTVGQDGKDFALLTSIFSSMLRSFWHMVAAQDILAE